MILLSRPISILRMSQKLLVPVPLKTLITRVYVIMKAHQKLILQDHLPAIVKPIISTNIAKIKP